jgi:PEP-CTERM motif
MQKRGLQFIRGTGRVYSSGGNLMKKTMLLLVGCLVLFLASPAWADTWDFSTPSGDLGTNTQTYTGTGGYDITAYGFWTNGDPANLYGKTGPGAAETGLGIADDPLNMHEISSADFVQLDMSDLASNGGFNGNLLVGSVQDGESFQVCVGGTLGSLGSCGPVIAGNGSNNPGEIVTLPVSWTANDHFVSIIGVNTDILVASGFEASVPEPATLLLLGTGLVGMATKLRRRIKKA